MYSGTQTHFCYEILQYFTELPQLNDPPEIYNVTCENVTLVWPKWKSGEDKGNIEATIARYE